MSYELDNGAKDSIQLAVNRLMRLRYRVKSRSECQRILGEACDLINDLSRIQDAADRRATVREALRRNGR